MTGEQGRYGVVSRTLHWVTLAALAAQFTVGWLLDVDDGGGGRGRGRGRGGESGRGRGRGGDDEGGVSDVLDRVLSGDDALLTAHVALGLTVLLLASVRLLWRRLAGLPPWAETLSEAERRWAHWTERLLYATLVVMPLSGLLVLLWDDDALPVHVGAHLVFAAALASHLGLVLKHQLVLRDGLLRRML